MNLHFRLLFVTLIMFILLFYIKCLLSYILDYNCNKPFLSSYSALCFLTKALSTPTLSFLCSVKLNPNIFPILNKTTGTDFTVAFYSLHVPDEKE